VVAGNDPENPLVQPTKITFAPDGRIFVCEKQGRVRVIDAEGNLQTGPWLDIIDLVNGQADRGLLGIAVDPNFLSNKYVTYFFCKVNFKDIFTFCI
jgi:glucose/arabinose dehydrogenase